MNPLIIFLYVFLIFFVMALLEKTIEGPNAWARKSYGWKYKIAKRITLTEYHLYFWVFLILLFLLPFVVFDFNLRMFGIVLSAFSIGFVFEDFFYFIVNPYFGIKKFNSKNANWYPWFKLGRFEIPINYLIGIVVALLSYFFIWR